MRTNKYIFLLLVLGYISTSLSIRVCKRFSSYYIPTKDCVDDPDPELKQAEIVRVWGFTAEEYNIETDDGYFINVIRGYQNKTKPNPVVFGHGIIMNGFAWIDRKNKSLPYILGLMGYEFWIINWRGTKLSRKHKTLSDKKAEYWKFSFHEMGIYDLPKILETVYNVTEEKAIYVGFSMGTTISYIFASEQPKVAQQRLSKIISLGPVAYLENVRSFLKYLVPFIPILTPLVSRHGQAFPLLEIPPQKYLCTKTPLQMFSCAVPKGFIFGFDFGQLDALTLPVTESLNYDSLSLNIMKHFAQIITTNSFTKYNYGKEENLIKYGQSKPPLYKLQNIELPTTLFVGENDWLATKNNGRRLYNELNPSVQCGFHLVTYDQWNHNDFLEAKNIDTVLYPHVTGAIRDESASRCTSMEK